MAGNDRYMMVERILESLQEERKEHEEREMVSKTEPTYASLPLEAPPSVTSKPVSLLDMIRGVIEDNKVAVGSTLAATASAGAAYATYLNNPTVKSAVDSVVDSASSQVTQQASSLMNQLYGNKPAATGYSWSQ
jgi:predicted sugar kinase